MFITFSMESRGYWLFKNVCHFAEPALLESQDGAVPARKLHEGVALANSDRRAEMIVGHHGYWER